jgi:hypothetical protein
MTVRKTLGGTSRIFDPKVTMLPLMSNLPTSLMTRNRAARAGLPIDELECRPQFYRSRQDAD